VQRDASAILMWGAFSGMLIVAAGRTSSLALDRRDWSDDTEFAGVGFLIPIVFLYRLKWKADGDWWRDALFSAAILRNPYVGDGDRSRGSESTGRAMGMTQAQILFRVRCL